MKTETLIRKKKNRIVAVQKSLQSKLQESDRSWKEEKVDWIKQIFNTVDAVDILLRQKEREFSVFFDDKGIKDLLFPFFHFEKRRVNGYLLLPLLPRNPREGEPQLALAWFIPTASISFRIYFNIGTTSSASDCVAVYHSLETKTERQRIYADITESTTRLPGEHLREIATDWNKHASFVTLLQNVFENSLKNIENLLDYVIDIYGARTTKGLLFSKRCAVVLENEKEFYQWFPRHGFGDRDSHGDRERCLEFLLDEGYPYTQKARVDVGDSDTCKYVLRTVRWIYEYMEFKAEQETYFERPFIMLHD